MLSIVPSFWTRYTTRSSILASAMHGRQSFWLRRVFKYLFSHLEQTWMVILPGRSIHLPFLLNVLAMDWDSTIFCAFGQRATELQRPIQKDLQKRSFCASLYAFFCYLVAHLCNRCTRKRSDSPSLRNSMFTLETHHKLHCE